MQNLSHAKENTITKIGTMTCACTQFGSLINQFHYLARPMKPNITNVGVRPRFNFWPRRYRHCRRRFQFQFRFKLLKF